MPAIRDFFVLVQIALDADLGENFPSVRLPVPSTREASATSPISVRL
jgi:hypothetical protein